MSEEYWENRWRQGETGWDMGQVSPPLREYIDQLKHKDISILIPGCGSAYEAEYLWKSGFRNVYLIDLSETAIRSFKNHFPEDQIFTANFFDHKGRYDLILEQTFFCAISPEDRKRYVEKCAELLNDGGKIAGLMFDFPLESGPPYGGSEEEYRRLFSENFDIVRFSLQYELSYTNVLLMLHCPFGTLHQFHRTADGKGVVCDLQEKGEGALIKDRFRLSVYRFHCTDIYR